MTHPRALCSPLRILLAYHFFTSKSFPLPIAPLKFCQELRGYSVVKQREVPPLPDLVIHILSTHPLTHKNGVDWQCQIFHFPYLWSRGGDATKSACQSTASENVKAAFPSVFLLPSFFSLQKNRLRFSVVVVLQFPSFPMTKSHFKVGKIWESGERARG